MDYGTLLGGKLVGNLLGATNGNDCYAKRLIIVAWFWTISGSNWSTFPIDAKFSLISLKSANFSSSFAIRMRFVSSISMDVTNCGCFFFLLTAPSKGTEGLVSIWSDSWELCGSAETSIPQLVPRTFLYSLCYGSFPPMGLTLHQLVHPSNVP